MQSSSIEALVQSFIRCTLPRAEWTHEAHLKVGLWHCMNFSSAEALNLMRERIKRYNVACGVINTVSQGYHETITQFYLQVISYFLTEVDTTLPIDDLAQHLIQNYGDRSLLLQHYSPEYLFSEKARLEWVLPDRKPFFQS